MSKWFALAALLVALCPRPVFSQQAAATLNGLITDSSGAVVEGAAVTLTNVNTSVSHDAVTNASGNYVFVDVLPGPYTLRVSKTGFNTITQSQFTLYVNQTATLNFTLAVGSTQQQVTVEGSAVQIQAATSELGTVITTQAVNDLPLNGRNFTQLLTLTPGASPVSVGQNSGGGGGFAGNAIGSFSFPALNGQRNRSNMFLLDGIVDIAFIGNYNFEPIVDTVQEFKVQSHNDEAEFGQVVGGIVNVVTKSGTNSFHGSLWEFVRNSAFDARNFFQASVNPLRQNQYGIAGGGPVWIPKVYNGKNRTFFYGGFEGYRQSQAAQNAGLTVTPAELGGNFSGVSNQLYNPYSTTPDPNNAGSYLRTAFPGNQIPSNLLNPAAVLYAKTLLPLPNSSGLAGVNELVNTPAITLQNTYQGRIDQTFGDHDVLFGRISYFDQNDSQSGGVPSAVNTYAITGWNWGIHETHTINPTSVLDLHFGRNWGDDVEALSFPGAPSGFVSQLQQLGFSPNFVGGFQGGYGPFIPTISISGYLTPGGSNVQDTRTADTWEFGGDYTKVLNRHTIKLGGNFATLNTRSPIFSLNDSFAATQTQNPENPDGTGNALASFLLGVPDSASKRNVLEVTHGGWVDGVYIQDQWKVNSKLTLNIGLRYDVTFWPIYGELGTPDSYVGDLNLNNGTYILTQNPGACTATKGFPCIPGGTLPPNVVVTPHPNHSIFNNDYGDWQGRAGFAYRLRDKTAIRAGYGRFYDNWNSVVQLSQNYEGNWPDVGQLIANNLNHPGGTSASIGDPFNLGSGGVVYPAATPFNQVNWFVDPTNYKMPYSDQWNFGIEQQLTQNTVLSLAYVGAHDLQLNLGGYRNTAVTPGPGDAATVASRQPYPYITPTYYDQSIGQSKYNSFQFRLQQRTTKGLSYLISYTRSKSMDVGCSGSFGAEGCEVTDPYNLNLDRSVSGFDLPNIFSGSFVYEIPIGKGRSFSTGHRTLDYVLGNWDLNGIVSFYSGLPFDVTVSNGDLSNTGNVTERANLALLNPYPSNKTAQEWINPAAFATPAPYTFGNLGRNTLRSDPTKNLDLSIVRRFPFLENYAFEFRADSFNLTNTPIFNIPNSTLGNPDLGVVTSTRSAPRELQFALKFVF